MPGKFLLRATDRDSPLNEDKPTSLSYKINTAIAQTSKTVDKAAANGKLNSSLIAEITNCAIMVSCGVPSNAGKMKKPRLVINTSRPAAAIPGAASGRNTEKKATVRLAPSVSAACSNCAFTPRMIGNMFITASGSIACTMPIITPLNDGARACGSSTRPSPMAIEASTPVLDSTRIQAKVFTR